MTQSTAPLNPDDYIITRKRKKYKFAKFFNNPFCYEVDEWLPQKVDVLEIGAGTGLFSVAMAQARVAKKFLAVDVKADRLQVGAIAAEAAGSNNLYFLRARADQLPGLIALASLEAIWVTFPDPFPKPRHAKNRLTHPKALKIYQSLLAPGGALYFKTDAKNLFDWSLEQLVAEGWHITELSFDLHDSNLSAEYKIKTTYETRYISEGLAINFVKATPPTIVEA